MRVREHPGRGGRGDLDWRLANNLLNLQSSRKRAAFRNTGAACAPQTTARRSHSVP